MTIKIALRGEKKGSVEEAQRKNLEVMKDKHLKEKRTLPEQFMMNDSRTWMTAEVWEEALTRLQKKTSPKSAQKNRISNNKRWLKDGLRKSPPKGSTQNINNPIKKTICWEEQLKMMLKHKALQKRITTKRIMKCWEEENHSEEKMSTPSKWIHERSRQWRSTTRLDPLQSKGKANKNRH